MQQAGGHVGRERWDQVQAKHVDLKIITVYMGMSESTKGPD